MRRKHLFKKRIFTNMTFKSLSEGFFKYMYSAKRFRLEFVYIRLFKKLFRRRFIKAKTRFFKPKYWLLFLPNFILTQKSKNARMGAGVGKFVRLTSIVSPGKAFLKTWYYNYTFLKSVSNYIEYKIPNKFLIKNVTNKKKRSCCVHKI